MATESTCRQISQSCSTLRTEKLTWMIMYLFIYAADSSLPASCSDSY
jgi:hypothetical protein